MDKESKIIGIVALIILISVGVGIFFLSNEENPDEYVYNNFRICGYSIAGTD